MQANALPQLVQLRELHRQELYAEADRERLVRQATMMPSRPQRGVSSLQIFLTHICGSVEGLRSRRAPAVERLSGAARS
jgi:hypothetical protein